MEPVSLEPKVFTNNDKKEESSSQPNRKQLYILADSMLNQMDQTRLSRYLDVKVDCHGGCTVKCMYTHLSPVINAKPDYIMLHIGTNDCISKTSDEVLNEISKLAEYIETALPNSKVILCLPSLRTDSKKANTIITNLKLKAKKLMYIFLENTNFNENHISKRGLHFNGHGIRRMAKNILLPDNFSN